MVWITVTTFMHGDEPKTGGLLCVAKKYTDQHTHNISHFHNVQFTCSSVDRAMASLGTENYPHMSLTCLTLMGMQDIQGSNPETG